MMRLMTPVKEGESIEKALKKHKKKFDKARIIKELRERQYYIKPSKIKRNKIIKARYKSKINLKKDE